MKKKVLVVSIVLAASLLLGACAAADTSVASNMEMPAAEPQNEGGYEYETMTEEVESAEASERSFTSGSGESASAAERMVIYNADLEIAVEEPAETMEAIIEMAEDSGGFVVYSNVSQYTTSSGNTVPRANLTVRVPAGELEPIMDAIKGLTPDPKEDVLSENVSGQDVTSEYTDLTSRLRNLEAAEEALVKLMEQAQDTEDVLDVFDELTYYRGEIEEVKGRMQYLEESAALSAISVQIVAKESLQPIEIAGWEPQGTAKRAVEALINTGQTLVDVLIWVGIYCLPFLVPLGIAVYFLVRLIRRRKIKKQALKTEPVRKEEQAQ